MQNIQNPAPQGHGCFANGVSAGTSAASRSIPVAPVLHGNETHQREGGTFDTEIIELNTVLALGRKMNLYEKKLQDVILRRGNGGRIKQRRATQQQ